MDNLISSGLSGATALVTGASSGIGAHLGCVLARYGCRVGFAGRRLEKVTEMASVVIDQGLEAVPLEMDVTDAGSVSIALDRLEAEFGTVNILVNNAGQAGKHGFLDAPADETYRITEVNQMAVWDVSQQVSRRLTMAQMPGSIINISSITGLRPVGGAASYAVSKAAVAHMTKIQALELALHRIRVNAIAPGYFLTELTEDFLTSPAGENLKRRIPMRRIGKMSELDGLLLLLASDAGSFITGAVIPVDGGHLLSSL